MNERNIEHLKARFEQLGFAALVETELRCRICFSPPAFELVHTVMSGADRCRFVVSLQRGDAALYDVISYQAVLRKEILVPPKLLLTDQKMSAVKWAAMAGNNFEMLDRKSIGLAYDLLKELEEMGSDADVLKFKYWVDTLLESLMPNFTALKNRYEIAERFYLVDDAHVISFAEAARFLNSKWIERQLVANRKLLVKKSEGGKNAGVGKGKLLTNNSRKPGRQGMAKKNS